MALTVRAATRDDAETVAELAHEFVDYLHSLGAHDACGITAQAYVRDGFGARPAFGGLVAEVDGRVVGYLLYHEGYDPDHGARLLHVVDLFVREADRGRGAGCALMERTAELCRAQGGSALVWSVYPPNALARGFYEKLGARYIEDVFMYWAI